MVLRNTPDNYGAVAKTFHWLIVILIIVQFTIGFIAEDMPSGIAKLIWLTRHKQIGMTIFGLAVLRLAWRLYSPPPPLPEDLGAWQRRLANATHFLLYALILVMPLVGWSLSSAGNHPVSYFGLFTLPDLVAPNEALKEILEKVHESLAWLLLSVATVHVAAALWHHFGRADNVLVRMLPLRRAGRR